MQIRNTADSLQIWASQEGIGAPHTHCSSLVRGVTSLGRRLRPQSGAPTQLWAEPCSFSASLCRYQLQRKALEGSPLSNHYGEEILFPLPVTSLMSGCPVDCCLVSAPQLLAKQTGSVPVAWWGKPASTPGPVILRLWVRALYY